MDLSCGCEPEAQSLHAKQNSLLLGSLVLKTQDTVRAKVGNARYPLVPPAT